VSVRYSVDKIQPLCGSIRTAVRVIASCAYDDGFDLYALGGLLLCVDLEGVLHAGGDADEVETVVTAARVDELFDLGEGGLTADVECRDGRSGSRGGGCRR
jgi:hypothetical protein